MLLSLTFGPLFPSHDPEEDFFSWWKYCQHIKCTPTCAGYRKQPEHLMKYNRHVTFFGLEMGRPRCSLNSVRGQRPCLKLAWIKRVSFPVLTPTLKKKSNKKQNMINRHYGKTFLERPSLAENWNYSTISHPCKSREELSELNDEDSFGMCVCVRRTWRAQDPVTNDSNRKWPQPQAALGH